MPSSYPDKPETSIKDEGSNKLNEKSSDVQNYSPDIKSTPAKSGEIELLRKRLNSLESLRKCLG